MPPIPATSADITPAWLTDALRTGNPASAAVATLQIEPLGAQAGFLCETMRLRLTYGDDGRPGPATLVAKLPATEPRLRATISRWGYYEREARFYQHLADGNPLRPPACHFAGHDDETGNTVVLMQDLAGEMLPNPLDISCPVEHAEDLVRRLARFQAAHWGAASSEQHPWVASFAVGHPSPERLGAAWQMLQEAVPHLLPTGLAVQAERLVPLAHAFRDHMTSGPLTLIHGDLRTDNLVLGHNGVRVVDWQTLSWARGGLDLGFMLTQNFSTDERRGMERDLVLAYHEELRAGGVHSFSFDDCWADYRLGHLRVATMFMQAGGSGIMHGERSERLLAQSLQRVTAAMEDLQPFDLLSV